MADERLLTDSEINTLAIRLRGTANPATMAARLFDVNALSFREPADFDRLAAAGRWLCVECFQWHGNGEGLCEECEAQDGG